MAETAKLYNAAFTALANKEIDWGSDTIRVILLASTYTPNQSGHDYLDDVIAHEITATGYTPGGATLANKTETYAGQVKRFDADDVIWPEASITARFLVLVDFSPATNATRPLIAYTDFGEDKISTDADFKIAWHADGIFAITVA